MVQDNNKPAKKKDEDSSEEHLPKEFQKIIDFIPSPEGKKEAYDILLSEITITSSYCGPLPRASEMVSYEQTLPGSADRIIKHAETQRDHRIEMEKLDFPEKSCQFRRGQLFSFIIGLAGLGVTTLLALMGHDWVAGVIGTITLGTILTTLHRHSKQN